MNDNEHIIGAAVELPLSSGITVLVQMLTPVILQRLNDKNDELFPMPDKAEYEKQIEAQGGIPMLPGTTATIKAEDNPEYVRAYVECVNARAKYLLDMILRLAVRAENEEKIIAYHASFVEEARKTGVLVEQEGDTPLLIVLRNFAATPDDFNSIVAAAQRRLPLTESEVSEGRKFFRLSGERDTRERVAAHKQTSRANGKASHVPEPTIS